MKRILFTLASALVLSACAGTVASSPAGSDSQGPKGDLAYFELRGNVKSMCEDGTEYNFDEDGRLVIAPEDGTVTIAQEEDTGLTTYTFIPAGEDPFEYWGKTHPFCRWYDDKGVLKAIAYHYEMWIGLYYNEDGTVSREDWGEETWGGCDMYNYQGGERVLALSHSGEIADLSGVLQEDVLWENFICYEYDECGNWTKRFGVTHYSGNVHGNVTRRTIEYYSKEKPEVAEPGPVGIFLFGKMGGKDAQMCISGLENEYYPPSGMCQAEDRKLLCTTTGSYDKATGSLQLEMIDSDLQYAGKMEGTLSSSPFRFQGVFTPDSGKPVIIDLSEE